MICILIAAFFFGLGQSFEFLRSEIAIKYQEDTMNGTVLDFCIVKEIQVESIIQCMAVSMQVSNIYSFGYNEFTRVCRTYSVPFQPARYGSKPQEDGWMYFKRNDIECPQSYLLEEDACICISYSTHSPGIVTYGDRQTQCAVDKAELVKIDSQVKQNAVQNYMSGLGGNPAKTLIQGRMYIDDIVTFDDGTQMTFTAWDQEDDEPDGLGGEPLAYIVIKPTAYTWHDASASGITLTSFICEIVL